MKYRLKKDTPEFKAGTVFDMVENIDVGKVLTMNAPREDDYAFEVDGIDNFDEWFEAAKEPKKHPEQRDKFTDFMGAVRVVSRDEGFMKSDDNADIVAISNENGTLVARTMDYVDRPAGSLFFDTARNAWNSIRDHSEQWWTILNYKWRKE